MQRLHRFISLGIGLIVAVPLLSKTPVLASLQSAGAAIAQAISGPPVKMNLAADKKTIAVDSEGQQVVNWQPLEGQAVVVPGDVLRYTVISENTGDAPAKNFVVTQPITAQMTYELGSAQSSGATITYSIDNGQTFVANPTIEVTLEDGTVEERPAPAEVLYPHSLAV